MLKSKTFRIGVAGDTTDGREINPAWLQQMAANFNPDKYGARIFCEHIRGYAPEGQFGAYGDVVALEAKEADIGGETKMALYAQIAPTPDLVTLNKKRQKVYTSMEISFNKDEQAYLSGLGITDTPASFGTEMLAFSAKADINPLAARKQNPDNLFSVATEVQFEFTEVDDDNDDKGPGLVEKVKSMFSKQTKNFNALQAELTAAVEAIATEVVTLSEQIQSSDFSAAGGQIEGITSQIETLSSKVDDDAKALADLRTELESTDGSFSQRPPASGGKGIIETDC